MSATNYHLSRSLSSIFSDHGELDINELELFSDDGESDTDQLFLCWLCGDEICGPRYSSSKCDFHLHKSCTKLPPRLEDHPFHPQHPLSLLPCSQEIFVTLCCACWQPFSSNSFMYRCSLCNFGLHPMCALSVGGEELFRCRANQHLLMLEEEQSTSLHMDGEICFVCKESMTAPFFFCSKSRCNFHLHKICADLPPQIRINLFHPNHPLFLFPKAWKNCKICGKDLTNQHGYVCIPCGFCIHPRCAFSNPIDVIKTRIKPSIPKLTMQEDKREKMEDILRADEQPQTIENNYFHPQHPLFLDSECTGECKICGKENKQPTYACKPCDFFCHLRCALPNPIHIIKSVGGKQIQHPSHDHSLTLVQNERERRWNRKLVSLCRLCFKFVSFPSYTCHSCEFIIHKSCAELPSQIKTHLHPDHFLFLFEFPQKRKPRCDCCDEIISRLNYRCLRCEFVLHVDCFFSLQGFQSSYDHEHCFVNLKMFLKTCCQTCGGEGYFTPWQCSACHLVVHKKCAALPRFLKLVSHHHRLKLTYYLSSVYGCDKIKCKLCHRKVNADYAAYYCSECNYAAHLDCAPKVAFCTSEEEPWISGEENQDDLHSSKESQNSITNSDITSSQEKDVKSGVIQHFSHRHELTLIEQDIEDQKYCEGCVGLVFSPFYTCKQCNFYLHKRCGEAPGTLKHPFHDHLLTLTVVEDLVFCNECGYPFNGFMYSCKTPNCTFKLDLQCADILSEGIQHPCHEHPLFFPYTRFHEECKGCGKNQQHILVCEECDYALGYCCLRIPHLAKHGTTIICLTSHMKKRMNLVNITVTFVKKKEIQKTGSIIVLNVNSLLILVAPSVNFHISNME